MTKRHDNLFVYDDDDYLDLVVVSVDKFHSSQWLRLTHSICTVLLSPSENSFVGDQQRETVLCSRRTRSALKYLTEHFIYRNQNDIAGEQTANAGA